MGTGDATGATMANQRLLVVTVVGALTAVAATLRAQGPPSAPGPVACFLHAARDASLDDHQAKRLCIGAPSGAPAQCFATAVHELGLSDLQAVRLCRGATSIQPASCATQLADTTDLEDAKIVSYCAARHWPLLRPPTAGSPVCVTAALHRTMMTTQQAVDLCRGSPTTRPVACFEAGRHQTLLGTQDLVDLCAPVVQVRPIRPS
jgi:hypothetical protein